MSKTLITVDNLEQFIAADGKHLFVDGALLTAGAKDELHKRGVTIVYGAPPETCVPLATSSCTHNVAPMPEAYTKKSAAEQEHDELLIGVAAVIQQHYGVTDPELLKKMTLDTVAIISKNLQSGY